MQAKAETTGLRELAIVDAAIAMRRASESKLESESAAAQAIAEPDFITDVMRVLVVTAIYGPVTDTATQTEGSATLGKNPSLKTMIEQRNKLAAAYGEPARTE